MLFSAPASHSVQVVEVSCDQYLGAGGRRFKSYRPDQKIKVSFLRLLVEICVMAWPFRSRPQGAQVPILSFRAFVFVPSKMQAHSHPSHVTRVLVNSDLPVSNG